MSLYWDIEELACVVLGKTEDELDEIINNGTIDEFLVERYGIDFETYSQIVKDLLYFTPHVSGALSGEKYHAFVKDNVMIVKTKVPDKAK